MTCRNLRFSGGIIHFDLSDLSIHPQTLEHTVCHDEMSVSRRMNTILTADMVGIAVLRFGFPHHLKKQGMQIRKFRMRFSSGLLRNPAEH